MNPFADTLAYKNGREDEPGKGQVREEEKQRHRKESDM